MEEEYITDIKFVKRQIPPTLQYEKREAGDPPVLKVHIL